MRKFRLMRERRDAPTHATTDTKTDAALDSRELRGLGDAEVFSRSGLFARLAVSGISRSDSRLQAVMEHYQLAFEPEETAGHLVLRMTHEVPGEHAVHSVALFFASIDLGSSHSGARFFLYQHNGFAHLLAERLERKPPVDPSDQEAALFSQWKKTHAFVSLHQPIQAHLAHAGLTEAHGSEITTLDHQQVERIKTAVFAQQHQTRRAG